MRYFALFVSFAIIIGTVLAVPVPIPAPAPAPLELGNLLSSATRQTCDTVVAHLEIGELANVDAFVCLDSSQPVPPAIEQATSQVSDDCNILKNSINAHVDATGLLKVRAVVCLPKVVAYVSLL